MHEFKIIADIFPLLEKVAAESHLQKITLVKLAVGDFRQCQRDFLEFAFETLAAGTIAAQAKLQIEIIPIKMRCRSCEHEFIVVDNYFVCPQCQATGLDNLTGKEIMLVSVEGEN